MLARRSAARTERHPQRGVRLGGGLSALLDERPECGVVEVIYVCCDADTQRRSVPIETAIRG